MADRAILRTLHQVRGRLTAVRAVESGLRWMRYGAMVAALVVALSALVFSFLPEGYPYPWPPLAVIPLAFALGVAVRLLRPPTLRDAAIYLDRRAGLEERVATAYELEQRGDDSPLGNLVRDEAMTICRRFRPDTIRYSRRLARDARYGVVGLVVCAAVLLVPPLRTEGYRQRELQRQRGRAAIARLREFIKQVPRREADTDPQLEKMRQEINAALAKMARASAATPDRNFAELNRVAAGLRKQRARNGAEKGLADSLKTAKEKGGPKTAFKTQAERDRLAEKMAGGKLTPAEKRALQQVSRAAAHAGEAAGDEDLKVAAETVRRAYNSGQGDSGSLSRSLGRIAKAGREASARQSGEGAAQRDQELTDALAAVEAAKASQGGTQSPGSRTADAGRQGAGQKGSGQKGSGQQPCSDCGGTGKTASGGRCATCDGTGSVRRLARGGGSTNMEQRGGPGDKAEHRRVTPEQRFVRIYDARRTAHSTEKVYVPGKIGPGESAGRKTIVGAANPDERSRIAFGRSFTAEAARQAEEALDESPVPADMRALVRRYFTPDSP